MIICQLYSDIMSTYGDRGNALYLLHFFEQLGLDTKVIWHRYGEDMPKANIYIFGGGQDGSQVLVSRDLQTIHGEQLHDLLQTSYCLAICGGYQLLGRSYITKEGASLTGLDFLPIMTVASSERMVGPVIAYRQFNENKRTVVGFENHSGKTHILDESSALATIIKGNGNNGTDKKEGIVYKKTIGTYLHGPILPRNPHVVYWWLKDLIEDIEVRPVLEIERLAHRSYLGQNK